MAAADTPGSLERYSEILEPLHDISGWQTPTMGAPNPHEGRARMAVRDTMAQRLARARGVADHRPSRGPTGVSCGVPIQIERSPSVSREMFGCVTPAKIGCNRGRWVLR